MSEKEASWITGKLSLITAESYEDIRKGIVDFSGSGHIEDLTIETRITRASIVFLLTKYYFAFSDSTAQTADFVDLLPWIPSLPSQSKYSASWPFEVDEESRPRLTGKCGAVRGEAVIDVNLLDRLRSNLGIRPCMINKR